MFKKAIEVDPQPPEPDNAYIDLANLYESQGKLDEANAIREKAPKTPSPAK